ncbi:MAG: hypothetical protein IT422_17195 [Pirellulaceae bacterium]|nr:hypothetical protein [Pirellulaceae bacterium]
MNNDHKATETALREIFRDMDGDRAAEIREAYYKALEGPMTLAEALEIADAKLESPAGPLLTEHFHAIEALDVMKRSRLGAVL